MNAFEIFNELAKTRQGRAAKAGEKFPEDVTFQLDQQNLALDL